MACQRWTCACALYLQYVREFQSRFLKNEPQKYTSPSFFNEFAENFAGMF